MLAVCGEVIWIEDKSGRKIKIEIVSDGILIENQSEKSTAVFKSKENRNLFLFSTARPNGSWKEFNPI